MSSSSQGNKTPYCPGPGGMKPCRRRRNQYWPRAILVAFHLTRAILAISQFNVIILLTASKQATIALPIFYETPCFSDNLQWSYYNCCHLASFSHTSATIMSQFFRVLCISPFRIIRFLDSYSVEVFNQFWVVYYKAKAIEAGSNECQLCRNSNAGPGQCCPHLWYLMLFNDCQ